MSLTIYIKLTEAEEEKVREAARGSSPHQWARRIIVREAERALVTVPLSKVQDALLQADFSEEECSRFFEKLLG